MVDRLHTSSTNIIIVLELGKEPSAVFIALFVLVMKLYLVFFIAIHLIGN
jgi:hypothetical protein